MVNRSLFALLVIAIFAHHFLTVATQIHEANKCIHGVGRLSAKWRKRKETVCPTNSENKTYSASLASVNTVLSLWRVV